jgi:mono/diheme cytochrome c family protein
MKSLIRRVVLLLVTSLSLGGWLHSSLLAHPEAKEINSPGESVEASKLFDDNCAKCHGKDGRAKTFRGKMVGARNLADAKWQEKATDEQVIAAMKKGPGAMPSFEKKFTQAEMESLAAYVRHFKQEETKPDKK